MDASLSQREYRNRQARGALARLRRYLTENGLWLPLAFAMATVVLLAARIHFGVDITDEGIYSMLPLRFARGDIPFVDELSPLQGSGVAMLPFVWAYTRIMGVTGLVLAIRWVYFALMMVSALCSFAFLRRLTSERVALALSFVPLLFVPWGMPSAGYGNAAMVATAISVSLGGYLVTGGTRFRRTSAVAAGICSAFAALCYPTTVIVLLVSLIWLWRGAPGRSAALAFLAGAAVVGLLALPEFLRGLSGVPMFLEYVKASTAAPPVGVNIATYAGGPAKLLRLGTQAWEFAASLKRLWVAVALVIVMRFAKRWAPFAIAGTVAWSVLPLFVLRPTDVSTTIVMDLHMFALLVYAMDREIRSPGLTWALALSTLYAVVVTYTSTGEFGVFAVGSLVAFPAILLVLVLPSLQATWHPKIARAATIAAVGLVVGVAGYSMWTAAWQDGRPVDLRTPITWGAYRGLFTTPEKAAMLRQLSGDLAAVTRPRDVVLAYDMIPGVYLLGDFRPPPTSIWYGNADSYSAAVTSLFEQILARRNEVPKVVVRRVDKTYLSRHLTNRWVESRYRVKVHRADYDILVLTAPTTP